MFKDILGSNDYFVNPVLHQTGSLFTCKKKKKYGDLPFVVQGDASHSPCLPLQKKKKPDLERRALPL